MSNPAFTAGAVEWVPPQSDITKPSKPSSFLSMAVSRVGFSHAHGPFTLLYEHITEPVPPCLTLASNAGR